MKTIKVSLMLMGLLAGGLLTSSIEAQAQKVPGATTAKGAVERQEGRKERQKLDLGLSKEQKSKMKAIRAEYKPKLKALRADTTLDPKQKREQMKALMLDQRKATNAILTPEQRTKLAASHKGMKHQKDGMKRTRPGK